MRGVDCTANGATATEFLFWTCKRVAVRSVSVTSCHPAAATGCASADEADGKTTDGGETIQPSSNPAERSYLALTDRQLACLRGAAQHKTAKEIGRDLGISYHAVESHLKAARKKLGASSTAEALDILDGTARPYYGHAEPPLLSSADGQYYRTTGLATVSSVAHLTEAGRLHEAAFGDFVGRPKRIWEYDYDLTPQRTLIMIGAATVIFIVALALLIVIGTGVDLLVAAQG